MGGLYLNKTDTHSNTVALNVSPPPASSLHISFLWWSTHSHAHQRDREATSPWPSTRRISVNVYMLRSMYECYRLNLHVGSCDPPPPATTVPNSAVHQNTRAVQHLQSNHLKPAPSSALTSIWTWLAEALLVCVCACGNKWVYSSSIYLVKQPILLPKLVRDYLFVTLATPSSCFTFSALGALLREGEKAVIDRATVAKWKHGHWRTTRNKDLLSWTSQVHLGYRCVGLFW